jgi:hypothetical protein
VPINPSPEQRNGGDERTFQNGIFCPYIWILRNGNDGKNSVWFPLLDVRLAKAGPRPAGTLHRFIRKEYPEIISDTYLIT